jgi:hypothetical protein
MKKKSSEQKSAKERKSPGQKPKYIFNPNGGVQKKRSRLDLSETDEDEREGLGDGRMGDASDLDRHLRDD